MTQDRSPSHSPAPPKSPTPEPPADDGGAELSIEEEMAALEAQVAEETEKLQKISAQQQAMMASSDAALSKGRARPGSPRKADASSVLDGALGDGDEAKVSVQPGLFCGAPVPVARKAAAIRRRGAAQLTRRCTLRFSAFGGRFGGPFWRHAILRAFLCPWAGHAQVRQRVGRGRAERLCWLRQLRHHGGRAESALCAYRSCGA